jgi:pimeloyl-ACP methyl ester carboxylesterase
MFITVNGKKVHYEEKGSGEPILFVHGWPASIKSLYKLYQLASKNHRAIILDLPGFGKSDNPNPEWGVGEYASHITTFMKELGLKKVNYFGHSFGGALGIYIASHNPDILNKLIISNSSYKREGRPKKSVQIIKSILKRITKLKPVEPIAKKYFYRIFFPKSDLLKAPHLESNFRKIVTEDLTEYLSDIKLPTLILWGQLDTVTPIHWAHELNEKIKKSKLKVFPNATHGLPLKYPQEVFEEIESFLS